MGAGRPRKFKSVKELEKLIEDYFNTITITYFVFDNIEAGEDAEGKTLYKKVPRLNNAGNQIVRTDYIEIPSILALCRYLDTDRKTLLEYEALEEFSNTIKRAKERIELYLEEQLYRKEQVTGVIFNLKNNFGWKDKQEVETTGETTVNNKIDFSSLTYDQLKELIKNEP